MEGRTGAIAMATSWTYCRGRILPARAVQYILQRNLSKRIPCCKAYTTDRKLNTCYSTYRRLHNLSYSIPFRPFGWICARGFSLPFPLPETASHTQVPHSKSRRRRRRQPAKLETRWRRPTSTTWSRSRWTTCRSWLGESCCFGPLFARARPLRVACCMVFVPVPAGVGERERER